MEEAGVDEEYLTLCCMDDVIRKDVYSSREMIALIAERKLLIGG